MAPSLPSFAHALPSTAPRRRARVCIHPRMESQKPPIDASARPLHTTRTDAPLQGPEAVLGVALAAAALIADLTRTVASKLSGSQDKLDVTALARSLDAVTACAENRSRELSMAKRARMELDAKLDATVARAAAAEQALAALGGSDGARQRATGRTEEVHRRNEILKEELKKLEEIVQNTIGQVEKGREEERKTKLKLRRAKGDRDALRAQADAAQAELHAADEALKEMEKKRVEKVKVREMARESSARLADVRAEVAAGERALGALRRELRARDVECSEMEREIGRLTSLIEAREMEMRDMEVKIGGGAVGDVGGGDARKSEGVLEEVRDELEAGREQLKAQVRLARVDVAENGDALEEVSERLGARGDVLSAGIRQAESFLKAREGEERRRDEAVMDVLRDINEEDKIE